MIGKYIVEFVLVFFILACEVNFTSSLKNKNRPCKQVGPCRCVFPSGGEVDLSALISHDFGWVPLNSTASVYYHPCTDATIVVHDNVTARNDCSTGVSICLLNNDTTLSKLFYTNLGKASEGVFSDKIEEPLSIEFPSRSSSVVLTCNANQDPPLLTAKNDNNHYILELISSHSCSEGDVDESGLSTGSKLVLIFFVLTVVYFGGGMITLKTLRGAEGKEMIPNYEFWADLPYLVRDGILFMLSGFQSSPSYDRI